MTILFVIDDRQIEMWIVFEKHGRCSVMLNTRPRYNALCENKQTRSSHRYANLVLSRYVIISDTIINAIKNYNSYISIQYVKLNLLNLLSINVPFVYLLYVPFYLCNWNRVKLSQGKNPRVITRIIPTIRKIRLRILVSFTSSLLLQMKIYQR